MAQDKERDKRRQREDATTAFTGGREHDCRVVALSSSCRVLSLSLIPLALTLSLALVARVAAGDDAHPKSLLANGSFETSHLDGVPDGWDRPDGLTMFWVAGEGRAGSRCMRFDTDVKDDEFVARRHEMEKARDDGTAPPPAKPKSKTGKLDYGTVAGLDGVSYYSAFVDVKPGMKYTLTAWARGERAGMTPKIWLKGYAESEGQRRVYYKVFKDCRCGTDWREFSITVCPTAETPEVRWMRVMLYPYWPQGTYWFDDVSLVEAGADPGFAARVAAKAEGREAEAKRKRDAEVAEARATIQFAAKALERFRADVGRYPTTAEGLAALATRPDGLEAWAGPYLGELDVDPWGAPYRYRSPGTRRAASFDLESWGPDGVEGGGDDVGAE